MSNAEWFFRKSGWAGDANEGPLSDPEMTSLAIAGKVGPETLVRHPRHTGGQWTALSIVDHLADAVKTGHANRQLEKQQLAAERAEEKARLARETQATKERMEESQRAMEREQAAKMHQAAIERQSFEQQHTCFPVFRGHVPVSCAGCRWGGFERLVVVGSLLFISTVLAVSILASVVSFFFQASASASERLRAERAMQESIRQFGDGFAKGASGE